MVTSGPISIALSRSRWRRRDRRLEPGSIPVGWSASIVQTIWRAGAAGSAPGLEGSPVRLAFLPVSDAGFGAQVFPFDGGAEFRAGRAPTRPPFAIAMDGFHRPPVPGRPDPDLHPTPPRTDTSPK